MKIVVRTVIAILIALVSAIAAQGPELGAAAAPPGIEFVHGFICDDDSDSTSPIHSTLDRGPPSQDHRTRLADDHGCRGTATRTDTRSGYCGTAHGALALTARANDSTSTTRRHVLVIDGASSAVTRAGVAAKPAIGFAEGLGHTALTPGRLQHGTKHLTKLGVLPAWSHKNSPGIIERAFVPILERPKAAFDHMLGDTRVRGFLGDVDGHQVAVFVYKEGPFQGQLASSSIPSPNQLKMWGVP